MKKNNLWNTKKQLPAVFSFLFISLIGLIGLTGCEDEDTPTITKYTVTFDANEGTLSSLATVKVKAGEKVTKPADPTRTDYAFVEWQKEDSTAFDFDTETITANITLTAQWQEVVLYTVTFNPNQGVLAGGNENNTVQVATGGKVTKPADPTRTDYTFVEWQKGDSTAFDFDTETITANITLTATWGKVQYTVIFNPNQGVLAGGNENNTVQVATGAKVTKPADPTRTDYTFVEWIKSDGTAFDFDTETITANITLTATWGKVQYTVIFNPNQGVLAGGNENNTVQVATGAKVTKPADPTRTDYTFVEWLKSDSTAFDFDTETITANITLTATWGKVQYTVIFNPNQGVLAGGNENNTVQVATGAKVTKPADPTRTDYTFVEWLKSDSTAFDFDTETITANITLTATWGKVQYTVIFNPNQGVLAGGNENNTVQVATGAKVTKPADPTRTDYAFVEWQKEDGTAFDFDTETITANITLTATWEKVQYTVIFNPNQGVLAGGNENNTVQVATGAKVTKPADPTRTDYTFVEWQKEDGAAFDFDTETITANITLTATWGKVQYTVIFNPNQGVLAGGNENNTVQVATGAKVTKPADPTRTDYTFVEWQKEGGAAFDFDTETITANITLTATWEKVQYTVIFNPNQGVLAGGNENNTVQVATGAKVTKPADPTRTDYTFVEWQKEGGAAFDFDTETITANITLTATWEKVQYTVIFNPNQGVLAGGNENNTVQVATGEKVTKPADPTRTDYTFVEWQKEGGAAFDFDTETITANITLTATWEKVQYTVIFNPNQGVLAGGNENNTVQVATGEKVTKPADPTRTDYTFVEWQKEGGAAFDFDTETITANITLTATWEKVQYTVTFDANQGTLADGNASSTVQVATGEKVTKPADPTRTDYIFVEWQKEGGAAFDFDTETITANITLTAKFVDAIGGTVTGASIALNAAKTGYEFSYTYTNPDGGTTGGTPIVTWATSDQADGAGATEVSTATTYLPTGVNRYKYLVGTLVVEASNKQRTTAQTVIIYPGFSTEVLIPAGGTRFSIREQHTALSFDGKLWIIGGFAGSNKNDVWSSTDGADWTLVTANGGFPARRVHASVVHNNKMWVIGGYTNQLARDVWSSTDGITWTQVTADGGFGGQFGHQVVSHNGAMFLMAAGSSNIWTSTDGATWTQITTTSVYSARRYFTSVIHNNKIFVIGGRSNDGTAKNDVWSSSDGIAWTQVTADGGFSKRQVHSSAVLDGKIFTLMGTSPNLNDVWSSTDGATWTQVTTGGFTARSASAVAVKDNKIFILGGSDGNGDKNDVWY